MYYNNHMIKLTSISNHIRCINLSIIITIKFHKLMLRCRYLVKFSLSRRDGDSNRFQPTRELFLTQTHTSPVGVALGHLWYNSGTVVGPISAAPSGILPVCQEVQAQPALRLTPLASRTPLLPRVCALSLIGSRPELSYSVLRSEWLIRPTKC